MHIHIIEDEPIVRRELKVLLENAMYYVTAADSFDQIVERVKKEKPDLILLDVNLPETSGFDICTQIREQMEIPIIFLTGRADCMDELTGILRGGDDYITKPYQAPILLARIGAVLKRAGGGIREANRMIYKDVELDISGCRLGYRDHYVELTKNEMKILHLLFQNQGRFVTRMHLVEKLWENQIFIDDNTLSVHISRIREKLAAMGVVDFIKTKRGMGYRI